MTTSTSKSVSTLNIQSRLSNFATEPMAMHSHIPLSASANEFFVANYMRERVTTTPAIDNRTDGLGPPQMEGFAVTYPSPRMEHTSYRVAVCRPAVLGWASIRPRLTTMPLPSLCEKPGPETFTREATFYARHPLLSSLAHRLQHVRVPRQVRPCGRSLHGGDSCVNAGGSGHRRIRR